MKALFALFLIVTPLACSAQNAFQWTERFASPEGIARVQNYIDSDDDGHYLLWFAKVGATERYYWIEQLNKDMSGSSMTKFRFDPGYTATPNFMEGVFRLHGKNYMAFTSYRKKEAKNALSICEVTATGALENTKELVNIVPQGIVKKGGYRIQLSPDRSLMVVLSYDAYNKKATDFSYTLTAFNTTDFTKLWSSKNSTGTAPQKYPEFKFTVDNNGNCLVFNKIKLNKNSFHSGLYGYNANSQAFTTFDLGLEGEQHVQDATFLYDQSGNLVFNATINDIIILNNTHTSHGRICFTISQGNKAIASHSDRFSDAFLEANGIEKTEGNTPFIASYRMKESHLLDNGNIVVLMESGGQRRQAIPNTSPIVYQTLYNYGYVLAYCVDPATGALVWSRKIKKSQVSSSRSDANAASTMSYLAFPRGNTVHLVYGKPSLKNPWKETDGQVYNPKEVFGANCKTPAFRYALEADGTLTYGEMNYGFPLHNFCTTEQRYPLSLRMTGSFVTRDGEVVLYADYNGVQYRYCRLDD